MTTARSPSLTSFLGLCLALAGGCAAMPEEEVEEAYGDEEAALEGVEEPARLAVSIEWGALPGYSTTSEAHDWSGAFVVSRGRALPVTAVDFEAPKDRIIATHRHNGVAFSSTTLDESDGLEIAIIDPTPSEGWIVLRYVWRGVTMWSVSVDPLTGVSAMLILDGGNRLSILGVPVD